MAEDPLELFSTRRERYPEPTEADVALGAGRAALAAIPIVGGTINELLSMVLAPAVARRRDTWFKELADGLEEAERKIEGFSVDNLTQEEAFVSATLQATQVALRNHQQEKREYLRNALLNVALGLAPKEDLQQTFIRYVDEFTVTHVKVLQFIAAPIPQLSAKGIPQQNLTFYRQAIEAAFPDLRGDPDFGRLVIMDFKSRGLSTLNPDESFSGQGSVTAHGAGFLRFISSPDALK